jgi:hypothetical protein
MVDLACIPVAWASYPLRDLDHNSFLRSHTHNDREVTKIAKYRDKKFIRVSNLKLN